MTQQPKQKLYCFVDESGQDSLGKIFIVSIVVTGPEYMELEKLCLKLETVSEKGKVKWHGSRRKNRLLFMGEIIDSSKFTGKLCFTVHTDITTSDFDFHTAVSIAETLHAKQTADQVSSEVYVDGLTKSKRPQYALQLRKLGISNARLHRATNQSSPLIRLADSLAGLIRDHFGSNDKEASLIFNRGTRNNSIVKI